MLEYLVCKRKLHTKYFLYTPINKNYKKKTTKQSSFFDKDKSTITVRPTYLL